MQDFDTNVCYHFFCVQENEETLKDGTKMITTSDKKKIERLFKESDIECSSECEYKTWWPTKLEQGGAYQFEIHNDGEVKVHIMPRSAESHTNTCLNGMHAGPYGAC